MAVSSPLLLAEFEDIIFKKFPLLSDDFENINKLLKKSLEVVNPEIELKVVRDDADNRVLEVALKGNCQYIITGDKDLLDLELYKKIKIVTVSKFLSLVEED